MLVDLFLVFIIIILLLALSMIWPPDSPWSPWWRTDRKLARAICKLAKISSRDLVYDLGCGDGTFIIVAAKEFNARCVGIEIDPLRFLVSAIRIRINKVQDKIGLKRKNFHNEDLSKASIVNVYLVPRTLEILKKKLLKELGSSVRIISYDYKMSLPLIAEDKKNRLYLHKLPKKEDSKIS